MSFVRLMFPALAVLPASLSAQSARWEQIWDQPETAIVYVDRASVAGPAELRSISTRTVYRGELPAGYISERIRTEEFDCVRPRSRLRHVTIVANDGRPQESRDWAPGESAWAEIESESLGSRKRDIACHAR